jgi:hypothetical protein
MFRADAGEALQCVLNLWASFRERPIHYKPVIYFMAIGLPEIAIPFSFKLYFKDLTYMFIEF